MQYVKTLLFLGGCFLLGICIANGVQRFRGRGADNFEIPHAGIGNAPRMHGFVLDLNDATVAAIDSLPVDKTHATAVMLRYPRAGGAGSLLSAATAKAHAKKLEVLLAPPPAFARGNPYPASLETVAQEAHKAKVDALCVSWLNELPGAGASKALAAGARKYFAGKIVYAATADVIIGGDEMEGSDCVGVIGPVTLPQRLPHESDVHPVDLQAMRVGWACVINGIESRAVKAGKTVMLLDMRVPATIRAKLPEVGQTMLPTPNLELQKLAYEALLVETKGRRATEGLFLPWDLKGGDGEAVNGLGQVMGRLEELWSPVGPGAEVVSLPVETDGVEN